MRDPDFLKDKDGDPQPDRMFCGYRLMSGNQCGEEAVLGIPKFLGSGKGRGYHEYKFSCERHRYIYVEEDWRDIAIKARMKEDEQKLISRFGEERVKQMSGYEKMRALLGNFPKKLQELVRKP